MTKEDFEGSFKSNQMTPLNDEVKGPLSKENRMLDSVDELRSAEHASREEKKHKITTQQRDGKTIIHLTGNFVFQAQHDFRVAYETAVNGNKKENKYVLVDFGQVTYMDSSGLGMLLVMRKFFKSKNVHCELIHAQGQAGDLLRLTHFDRYFALS